MEDEYVILLGHPRSGNNWTLEILHMVLAQKIEYAPVHLTDVLLDHYVGEEVDELISETELKYFASHRSPYRLPKQILEKRLKIVWVLRNPKDMTVSLFNLYKTYQLDWSKFEGSWSEFLDGQLHGDFLWGSWFDNTLDMERFMKQHPEIPMFVSLFEDKKKTPVESIRKLCHFLGKPDHLAEEIAKATEFSVMKKATSAKQDEFNGLLLPQGDDGMLRDGVIGNWKLWFTVAQNEEFDRMFEEKMGDTDVVCLLREYI